MRKILVTLLTGMMLMVSTSAMALMIADGPYADTVVGERDNYLASADLGNSGSATELAWVQEVLGTDVDWITDYDYDSDEVIWLLTDDTGDNTYAFNLRGTPDFFIIKTGSGTNDSPNDHFLFENFASLEWAVLNLTADFGVDYEIKNIGKFSHGAEIGGGDTPVPEPGTMMLLGVGMFGLAIFGKRRMNKES